MLLLPLSFLSFLLFLSLSFLPFLLDELFTDAALDIVTTTLKLRECERASVQLGVTVR